MNLAVASKCGEMYCHTTDFVRRAMEWAAGVDDCRGLPKTSVGEFAESDRLPAEVCDEDVPSIRIVHR